MATITLGRDDEGRDLVLHTWDEWAALRDELPTLDGVFLCVICADTLAVPADVIGEVMDELMNRGCYYIFCWGPDCERVHDIFDDSHVWRHIDDIDEMTHRMSTWHNNESLEDTLWLALTCAPDYPDAEYPEYKTVLGLCQRRENWPEIFTRAFSAPDTFCDDVMAVEDAEESAEEIPKSGIHHIKSSDSKRRTFFDFRKP